MNTIQELKGYGIADNIAKQMIESYKRKIGTVNGVYEITDIIYIPQIKGKEVHLRCSICGKEIVRELIANRNKWCELIKHCECEKQMRLLKILKNKKSQTDNKIGKHAGAFTITGFEDNYFVGKCDTCGNEERFYKPNYFKGKYDNCNCKTCNNIARIKYNESYIGKRNNYLTVEKIIYNDKGRKKFLCRCDCGNYCNVEPNNFEYGTIKSCGCMHDEFAMSQDGLSDTRIYVVWSGMMARCYNHKTNNYRNYGGRGISVCEEWHDVREFAYWAYNNGYNDSAKRGECTIDRINVDDNYCPQNCRWISIAEQQRNKRPAEEWKERERITYTYGDKTYNIDELGEISGVRPQTLIYRMNVKGLTVNEAVEMNRHAQGRPRKANNENDKRPERKHVEVTA